MNIKELFNKSSALECNEDFMRLKDSVDYALSMLNRTVEIEYLEKLLEFSHSLSVAIKGYYELMIKEQSIPEF